MPFLPKPSRPIAILFNAISSNATSSNVILSNTISSNAISSNAISSDAVSSDAISPFHTQNNACTLLNYALLNSQFKLNSILNNAEPTREYDSNLIKTALISIP